MHLSLSYSWTVMAIGVIAVLASAYFSYSQWRSSSLRRPVLLLELLRLLIIVLIFFTLLRPEIVTKIQQKTEPEIAILYDQSASMNTTDMVKPAPADPESRKECLDRMLEAKFYAPIEKKFKISLQGFSPVPDPAKSADSGDIEGTDIDDALNRSMTSSKNLRAVILMTDGSWNKGASPVGAAVRLRSRQAPVYSVVFGGKTYLPDMELRNIKAPSYCLMNEKIAIPFQIDNHMPRDVKTKIRLTSAYGAEADKEITLPAESTYGDSIIWQPQKEGKYTLKLEIPDEKDELNKANNSRTFEISVKKESLRVLIVESLPRWEYRYLRNAISRDPGMEINTVLYLPEIGMGGGRNYLDKFPEKNELSKYDVIFLGDVGVAEGQLKAEDVENIKGLVRHQGSGLVFLPGMKGKELSLLDGPLAELIPVEMDRTKPEGLSSQVESKLVLTTTGKDHFLTMLADNPSQNSYLWRELPGFYWNSAVLSAKTGSNILAVHSATKSAGGRMPLLVIKEYGSGNVLFMGTDSAWRWRKGVEDKYHYRFWGQVVRWMAHKRHLAHDEGIRLFFTPENPKAGQTVFLNATIHDRTGMPVDDAEIIVNVKDKGGKSVQRLKLFPEKGGWGTYKGEFIPEKNGVFTLLVESEKNSISMKTEITVSRESREKTGEPANWNILKEVSQISGGELAAPEDIDKLVTKIMALPKYIELEKRFMLWCQWWWCLIILVLISSYWTGRKMMGMI